MCPLPPVAIVANQGRSVSLSSCPSLSSKSLQLAVGMGCLSLGSLFALRNLFRARIQEFQLHVGWGEKRIVNGRIVLE